MILSEIHTAVQRQGGDSSGALFTTTDITRWANEGQLVVVRKTECLSSHKQTNVIAADGSYELPEDFLMMKRVTLDGYSLIRTNIDDLDNASTGVDLSETSTPSRYYLTDRTLFLYPSPDTAGTGTLDIWYIRQPVTLSSDEDTPEIPVWMHKEIVQYCLAQVKELDDDIQGQQAALNLFDTAVQEMKYEIESQPLSSYPAVRVLPGDWG